MRQEAELLGAAPAAVYAKCSSIIINCSITWTNTTIRFAAIFGSGVKMWDDLRSLLSENVYYNSSLVGVFSGKKLRL